MPRKPRLYQQNIPCHIIQRGNNRTQCFFCDDDYRFYLKVLFENLTKYKVQLHAFVLMTNHVHLLMTPSDHQGISNLMKILGIRYVRYINGLYKRTGTLWEGRHKACLIDSKNYLLHCYRYIELNPVRAFMVKHPGDYEWSSYQINATGSINHYITPHHEYMALGTCVDTRQKYYKKLFEQPMSALLVEKLRNTVQHNYPLGGEKFKANLEKEFNINLKRMFQGRPTKSADN